MLRSLGQHADQRALVTLNDATSFAAARRAPGDGIGDAQIPGYPGGDGTGNGTGWGGPASPYSSLGYQLYHRGAGPGDGTGDDYELGDGEGGGWTVGDEDIPW